MKHYKKLKLDCDIIAFTSQRRFSKELLLKKGFSDVLHKGGTSIEKIFDRD